MDRPTFIKILDSIVSNARGAGSAGTTAIDSSNLRYFEKQLGSALVELLAWFDKREGKFEDIENGEEFVQKYIALKKEYEELRSQLAEDSERLSKQQ